MESIYSSGTSFPNFETFNKGSCRESAAVSMIDGLHVHCKWAFGVYSKDASWTFLSDALVFVSNAHLKLKLWSRLYLHSGHASLARSFARSLDRSILDRRVEKLMHLVRTGDEFNQFWLASDKLDQFVELRATNLINFGPMSHKLCKFSTCERPNLINFGPMGNKLDQFWICERQTWAPLDLWATSLMIFGLVSDKYNLGSIYDQSWISNVFWIDVFVHL